MANIAVRQIKGLVLVVDPRQVTQPHVVRGRNFMVDVEGPYSTFGSELVSYATIKDIERAQEYEVDGHIVIFTDVAIFQYHEEAHIFYPIFVFPEIYDDTFPWTMAFVGDCYYFAKRGSALIEYDTSTGVWAALTASPVPELIYGVTQSYGRLIVLAHGVVAWSAIDNGRDLTPSLATGAGAQSLTIVRNGEPFAVYETPSGFLTYTAKGIMKSTFIDTVNPFRHQRLQTSEVPIGAYAITTLSDGSHVFLSRTGFWLIKDENLEPWQVTMSEYFKRKVFPYFNLNIEGLFRFHYDNARQWFAVSVAENEAPTNYTIAYILYIPRDEWGVFNRQHVALCHINVAHHGNPEFAFGYFTSNGALHRFVEAPHVELWPYELTHDFDLVDYRPTFFIPSRVESDGITNTYIFSTFANLFTTRIFDPINVQPIEENILHVAAGEIIHDDEFDEPILDDTYEVELTTDDEADSQLGDIYLIGPDEDYIVIIPAYSIYSYLDHAGLFTLGEGFNVFGTSGIQHDEYSILSGGVYYFRTQLRGHVGFTLFEYQRYSPQYAPLDAEVEIGLFRFTENKYPDELNEVNNVTVGTLPSIDPATIEDWMIEGVSEDWLIEGIDEDWGFNIPFGVDFNFALVSTLDGEQPFNSQDIAYEPAWEANGFYSFTPHQTGLYHLVRISAEEDQQLFHVKLLEISGILAGRL